jgi:Leucine-rich repeat (LRR) protein
MTAQLAHSFTDPKSQKCYYLNQDVFEIATTQCEDENILNINSLTNMINVCDFLICPTLVNALIRLFVEKSKELPEDKFNHFSENSVSCFKKHLKRKELRNKIYTYIPECNVIDYIILNNGLLPIHNNQIDLSGITNKAKLTTLDGLEIIATNTDVSLITAIDLGSNYLSLTDNFTILQKLPNLRMLILASNQLIQLPDNIFSKFNQLQTLDLRNNNLSQLPENIFHALTQLQRLYLNYNQLTELPQHIFDNLLSLTELSLRHNKLTQLPENIFDSLAHLQDLRIDYNQLTSLLENVFHKLGVLRILHLNNNKLSKLPENIFDYLFNLEELDLANNPLSYLSEKIVSFINRLNQQED